MNSVEKEEQDPKLLIKRNFNNWTVATHQGESGNATRLDRQLEPGVLKTVNEALQKDDMSGLCSTGQLVLQGMMQERAAAIQKEAGRLDQTLEQKLAGDEVYNRLSHQEGLLATGDVTPLSEEPIFDGTMRYLNEQELKSKQG